MSHLDFYMAPTRTQITSRIKIIFSVFTAGQKALNIWWKLNASSVTAALPLAPGADLLGSQPLGWPGQIADLWWKASLPFGLPTSHYNTLCLFLGSTKVTLCLLWPEGWSWSTSVTHLSFSTMRSPPFPLSLSFPKISVALVFREPCSPQSYKLIYTESRISS